MDAGACWADAGGGRAWELTREETNLGDSWRDARNGDMCMRGDAGELSSACGEMQEEMQEEMQGSSQVQTAFSPS